MFRVKYAMLFTRCMLVCVCVSRIQVFKWKANLRVGQSWVPFLPKSVPKLRTQTLVVRSKVLSQKDAIFIVPRPYN